MDKSVPAAGFSLTASSTDRRRAAERPEPSATQLTPLARGRQLLPSVTGSSSAFSARMTRPRLPYGGLGRSTRFRSSRPARKDSSRSARPTSPSRPPMASSRSKRTSPVPELGQLPERAGNITSKGARSMIQQLRRSRWLPSWASAWVRPSTPRVSGAG
jgi:hypothetical protein